MGKTDEVASTAGEGAPAVEDEAVVREEAAAAAFRAAFLLCAAHFFSCDLTNTESASIPSQI